MQLSQQIWPALFGCLTNAAEEVVRLDIEALAYMASASEQRHFGPFIEHLLRLFRDERPLLLINFLDAWYCCTSTRSHSAFKSGASNCSAMRSAGSSCSGVTWAQRDRSASVLSDGTRRVSPPTSDQNSSRT